MRDAFKSRFLTKLEKCQSCFIITLVLLHDISVEIALPYSNSLFILYGFFVTKCEEEVTNGLHSSALFPVSEASSSGVMSMHCTIVIVFARTCFASPSAFPHIPINSFAAVIWL